MSTGLDIFLAISIILHTNLRKQAGIPAFMLFKNDPKKAGPTTDRLFNSILEPRSWYV